MDESTTSDTKPLNTSATARDQDIEMQAQTIPRDRIAVQSAVDQMSGPKEAVLPPDGEVVTHVESWLRV